MIKTIFSDTQFDIKVCGNYRYIMESAADNPTVTLVMIHGLFGGLNNFDGIVAHLRHIYQTFVPELPIYHNNGPDTLEQITIWTYNKILEQTDGDLILFGNSLGGQIAIKLYPLLRHRIKGLVLSGSAGIHEHTTGNTKPRRYDISYIRELANSTFYSYQLSDSDVDAIADIFADKKVLNRLIKLARSSQKHKIDHILRTIECPVLLPWGENDTITDRTVAETFQKTIPQAEIRWISECGHSPMIEHPDLFTEISNQFIQSILTLSETLYE